MCDCPLCKPPKTPVQRRPVPRASGEAAIYSPEYLERKEGNRFGTQPEQWKSNVI